MAHVRVAFREEKYSRMPLIKCTCGWKRPAYLREKYMYILESSKAVYMGGVGSQHKQSSNYTTLVCRMPGCLGRIKVMWNMKDLGIEPIMWHEYVARKRAEGIINVPPLHNHKSSFSTSSTPSKTRQHPSGNGD